jgi:hypothetical protein
VVVKTFNGGGFEVGILLDGYLAKCNEWPLNCLHEAITDVFIRAEIVETK